LPVDLNNSMEQIVLHGPDFTTWRAQARRLLESHVPPERVHWIDGNALFETLPNLPQPADATAPPPSSSVRVPQAFVRMAQLVAYHRDPEKWSLLYRTLWRTTHGEPHLLQLLVDDDIHRLLAMEKAVCRDEHKMHAFVRFRKVEGKEGDRYVAWHRPDHPIVRLVADFFRQRFGVQRWTILTPDESVSWDRVALTFGPGVPHRMAPQGDEVEAMWKTYYASIFNPARVKVRAMKKEMPVRHWATLPEAELIDGLLRDAPARVEEMVRKAKAANRDAEQLSLLPGATVREAKPAGPDRDACTNTGSARPFIPETIHLPVLAKAAKVCKGCDLYCNATQTVFGEGPEDAELVMVGEQPGDSEDLEGRPFVGPAGRLLDEVMERVGLPRDVVYVTNAVKHFKFDLKGKRRIHAKPSAREVSACRPWLEAELAIIKPKMLVCLGSTAAQSLLGRDFRVTRSRGELIKTEWAPWAMATIHPSALLRIPDAALKERSMAEFESDLRKVAEQLKKLRRK
jgi:probable DNA metabolism protein